MTDTLWHQYQQALGDMYDLGERLERERLAEQTLQERTAEMLTQSGRPDLVHGVWHPTGYEPGAALNDALSATFGHLWARIRLSGLSHPPQALVGVWPDESANARAARSPIGGGVIYVNTGLIVLLRILAQYAAAGAGAYLENPGLGSDIDAATLRPWVEQSIVGVVVGAVVRAEAPVWGMHGPRDGFRRELVDMALWYVVAHEYAHLVNTPRGGGIDCVALNLRPHLQPLTESQVLNSQWDELQADIRAYDILFADQAQAPREHLIMVTLGVCLALSLQSATYHVALAVGSDDWGWSHPPPDARVAGLYDALERRGLERQRRRAELFLTWAEDVFAIDAAKSRINARLQFGGTD